MAQVILVNQTGASVGDPSAAGVRFRFPVELARGVAAHVRPSSITLLLIGRTGDLFHVSVDPRQRLCPETSDIATFSLRSMLQQGARW
jgi:hypothetical protein